MSKAGKQGEVVVVTGASAGVGRAVAREFGRRRARVGLIARGADGLAAAKHEIEQSGGEALALPVDVADASAVQQAADQVVDKFGPLDVWVNNAMTSVFSPFTEMTAEEFQRVTHVTYLGSVHGTMAALRHMRPRDHGTIVQVGSALAFRSIPLQSAYCGAKHALVGFFDSLRCELIHERSHIHLTMVHLPAMNTPQFGWVKSRLPHKAQPVPPIYQPEVAARAIYAAAHSKRRSIQVGLSTVEAILGNKLIPGTLDHYLGRTGYAAQQTGEPRPDDQPVNLWQPVAGDWGARGAFAGRARERSLQVWMNLHRAPLALLGGAAVLAGAAWATKRLA